MHPHLLDVPVPLGCLALHVLPCDCSSHDLE
jgi:hypothetical protein